MNIFSRRKAIKLLIGACVACNIPTDFWNHPNPSYLDLFEEANKKITESLLSDCKKIFVPVFTKKQIVAPDFSPKVICEDYPDFFHSLSMKEMESKNGYIVVYTKTNRAI